MTPSPTIPLASLKPVPGKRGTFTVGPLPKVVAVGVHPGGEPIWAVESKLIERDDKQGWIETTIPMDGGRNG